MSEYTQSISQDGAYIHRPDGEMFPLVQAVYELNNLLARAESAEKMADHWENKAKVKLLTPSIDWQRVKMDAAIAAIQGMLARSYQYDAKHRAEVAVKYADALVAELKKEVAE